MNSPLTLPLTELLKFQLRGSTLNVDLCSVIAMLAFLALKPHMFAFDSLGHVNLSQKNNIPKLRSQ